MARLPNRRHLEFHKNWKLSPVALIYCGSKKYRNSPNFPRSRSFNFAKFVERFNDLTRVAYDPIPVQPFVERLCSGVCRPGYAQITNLCLTLGLILLAVVIRHATNVVPNPRGWPSRSRHTTMLPSVAIWACSPRVLAIRSIASPLNAYELRTTETLLAVHYSLSVVQPLETWLLSFRADEFWHTTSIILGPA